MNNQDQKPTITLAQWCAYLPYGLMLDINGKDYRLDMYDMPFVAVDINKAIDLNAKPLLRPMNESAEYEVNKILEFYCNTSEYRFYYKTGFCNMDMLNLGDFTCEYLPYKLIQALLSNHYDIFNLIGQGLALPIE